jgi:hypothetical protein
MQSVIVGADFKGEKILTFHEAVCGLPITDSYRLFSAERAQSQGGNFVSARVRMFKNESTRNLRLWTSRLNQPLNESIGRCSTRILPLSAA